MLRIGFADYYLDNWHCNEFPGMLRDVIEEKGIEAEVTHAFGYVTSPDGVTSEEWCKARNMICCSSMEELIDSVDAICVIVADLADKHEEVARLPLMSGKPVFVDKTFAPDLAAAKRMFDLAEANGTPVFSASAERFNPDIIEYKKEHKRPLFMSTVGPHSIDRYAVHQLDPIVYLMGCGAVRVKGYGLGTEVTQMIIDYGDGHMASFMQTPQPYAEFNTMVTQTGCGMEGARLKSEEAKYPLLMQAILDFFMHGTIPETREETQEVVALIDAAYQVRQHPDTWIEVER